MHMRNKKISMVMSALVAVFFSLMLYLTPAHAKDVDIWADSNYDFKNVKAFSVTPVEFEVNKHVRTDELSERKVNDYNKSAVLMAGYDVLNKGDKLTENALTLSANIELWDTSEIWNEPYTSWETRYHTRVYRDRDGKEYYETIPYEVPVYHPGYYTYYSIVQVSYEARDLNGNVVYIHKEMRNRSALNAHYEMYERITKDFFSKFKNHVKDLKKAEEKAKKEEAKAKKAAEKAAQKAENKKASAEE